MRKFIAARNGTSAVEFAIIVPVFIMVLFGVIEFSVIFFTYQAAGHAAWDVTRQLATNQITTAQVSQLAVAELPSWVQSSATVTVTSSSANPSTNHYTVKISFPATAATITHVINFAYSSLTLNSSSTMQQEPTS